MLNFKIERARSLDQRLLCLRTRPQKLGRVLHECAHLLPLFCRTQRSRGSQIAWETCLHKSSYRSEIIKYSLTRIQKCLKRRTLSKINGRNS